MRVPALIAAMVLSTVASAQQVAPGRVLVRFRSARALAGEFFVGGKRARGVRRLTADTHLVAVEGEPRAIAAELAHDPDVAWAEPDFVRTRAAASTHPDDPWFPQQWGLQMIRAPEAWSRTTGSGQITVAVLDTGSLPHEDLKTRWVAGYDFISDPAAANDGDGRDPDPTDAGDATDASSALHGVHVAGIIGAQSNNTLGVTGVDWNCQLQPVRVLGVNQGQGVDSDIADAIRWAAGLHVDGVPDNATPAQVINLSFGGLGISQTMQGAVDDAVAQGVILVAAAGNLAVDAATTSPAGLDGVIAVGGVDPTGQPAPYSNFGASVALMAPGGLLALDAQNQSQGIVSTLATDQYVYYAGTSQAAAFVSATVSLMKALAPRLNAADAKRLLQASADPSGQCAAGCGAGLLDVDAALVLSTAGPAPPSSEGANVVGGCALAGRAAGRAGYFSLLILLALAVAAARRWV